jgi:hypothetical protein
MRVATVVAASILAMSFTLQPSFAKPVTSDDLVKAQENTGEWLT